MPLFISAPGNPEPLRHARDWLGHLRSGRITTKPNTTRAQLARHIRNELVVLGERE